MYPRGTRIELLIDSISLRKLMGTILETNTGWLVHWDSADFTDSYLDDIIRLGGYKIILPKPKRNLPSWW